MPEVLKVAEVAELLRVSKATVQRWCANGQLPAFKIGQHWRIDAALLKEMIEEATGPLPDSDVLNDVL
jgi:excisionase family DNA binding protein